MSEEILKALMQLFAIIAKQDEGLGDSEREYVEVFLKQQISAEAVADYLAELGVKRHEQLFTKGFGAEKPIAPNTTEKGKSRNRRVEITILEK